MRGVRTQVSWTDDFDDRRLKILCGGMSRKPRKKDALCHIVERAAYCKSEKQRWAGRVAGMCPNGTSEGGHNRRCGRHAEFRKKIWLAVLVACSGILEKGRSFHSRLAGISNATNRL